jgi:hypothetical protein
MLKLTCAAAAVSAVMNSTPPARIAHCTCRDGAPAQTASIRVGAGTDGNEFSVWLSPVMKELY